MEVQQTNFQFENLLQDVMEWLEPLLEEKSLQHELIFLSVATLFGSLMIIATESTGK